VIEEEIQIRTADGTSDGFLYRSPGGRRRPGVIQLTDIGGIRPASRDMARRLAAEGYVVLMPNVFYRTGRPPVLDVTIKDDEHRKKRFAELAGPLTPDAMERDASDFVNFLAAHETVSEGAMGVVGYCFTGSMAMRTAAARADKMVVAASFHGGGLFTDAPTSPHFVLPRVTARLYFGHAVNDRSMPEEAIGKLVRALEKWGGAFESDVYEGASHGWTMPDSPVYNQPQGERAFKKLADVFAATLK
jgi:carboxymethylenebutenolidase